MEKRKHIGEVLSSTYGVEVLDEESLLVTRSNGCGRFVLTMKVVDKKTPITTDVEFIEQGTDFLKRLSNSLQTTPPNGKPEISLCRRHKLCVTSIEKKIGYNA